MRRLRARGFTLIELIIALTLSIMVLVGVIGVATQMVRYEFESAKKGRVTGMSLYGLQYMNKELEDATHLIAPAATGDVIRGCTNWSAVFPPPDQRLDTAAQVTSFYYCVVGAPCDFPRGCTLYRHQIEVSDRCNVAAPPSCGTGNAEALVNGAFFRRDGAGPRPFFTRSPEVSGLELHYIVGVATPTAAVPTPIYFKFDIRIGMNKAYNNVAD